MLSTEEKIAILYSIIPKYIIRNYWHPSLVTIYIYTPYCVHADFLKLVVLMVLLTFVLSPRCNYTSCYSNYSSCYSNLCKQCLGYVLHTLLHTCGSDLCNNTSHFHCDPRSALFCQAIVFIGSYSTVWCPRVLA